MKNYTGFEYICIDIANQYGLDKELFEDRIKWVLDNINDLETMKGDEKNYPLYMKAVMALRKAQKGEPTGHLVGLDATCSGMAIMSCLTGCVAGSQATNLVNTGMRQDAYTNVTAATNAYLNGDLTISRKDIKQAVMTALYGSKAIPRGLFGEDTPELMAFYAGLDDVCPGAVELLQDLLSSWQPYATEHAWILPDNFHAVVKVVEKVEKRIEVDELDHATFTYEYNVIAGTKADVKNAANVTHSLDGYILRTMKRMCTYNPHQIHRAMMNLIGEKHLRADNEVVQEGFEGEECPVHVYVQRFRATGMADPVILPYLVSGDDTAFLDDNHIKQLIEMCELMRSFKPFELICIHDEYKAHPNNMNHVRKVYIDTLARMAESTILQDIFMQITGHAATYSGANPKLGEMIRNSEYALS